MNEQDLHNDPWRKKLQEVPVPDVQESWKEMHLLLDTELPVAHKNDRLKWVLLLVLLLCAGVCNCPGIWRRWAYVPNNNENPAAPATAGIRKNTTGHAGSLLKKRVPGKEPLVRQLAVTTAQPAGNTMANGNRPSVAGADAVHRPVKGSHPFLRQPGHTGNNLKPAGFLRNVSTASGQSKQYAVKKDGKPSAKPQALQQPDDKNPLTGIDQPDTANAVHQRATVGTLPVKSNDTGMQAPLPLPGEHDADSLHKLLQKTAPAKAAGQGFAFAIGINHFIRIGHQQPAAFNSDGTTGVLKDYIPVPQLRYYWNKKAYVQVEVQWNAPQYTKKLLTSEQFSDTSAVRPRVRSALYIKKLFYANLPLSVHYSPFKNVFAGAGLQFSSLRNGVILLDEKQLTPNRPDSTITEKVYGFKRDSVLAFSGMKTVEWRFLLDVNYQWKRFTPGIRYNRAFTRFINIRVSNTQLTQARNQSLQLYLRYTVWRKPKALLSPAK